MNEPIASRTNQLFQLDASHEITDFQPNHRRDADCWLAVEALPPIQRLLRASVNNFSVKSRRGQNPHPLQAAPSVVIESVHGDLNSLENGLETDAENKDSSSMSGGGLVTPSWPSPSSCSAGPLLMRKY